MGVTVIEAGLNGSAPRTYTLSQDQTLEIRAAFAKFDGTGAASAFRPSLAFYGQNGKLFSRVYPTATVPAGGTAQVSYAPFPGGIGPVTAGGLALIASSVLAVDTATIDFPGIPATFRNLQITLAARSTFAAQLDIPSINFNGDAAANYWTQGYAIEDGNTFPTEYNARTSGFIGEIPGATAIANAFGALQLTLPAYKSTVMLKSFTTTWGETKFAEVNHVVGIYEGMWKSTAAINRITLAVSAGQKFVAGTEAYLYGY